MGGAKCVPHLPTILDVKEVPELSRHPGEVNGRHSELEVVRNVEVEQVRLPPEIVHDHDDVISLVKVPVVLDSEAGGYGVILSQETDADPSLRLDAVDDGSRPLLLPRSEDGHAGGNYLLTRGGGEEVGTFHWFEAGAGRFRRDSPCKGSRDDERG